MLSAELYKQLRAFRFPIFKLYFVVIFAQLKIGHYAQISVTLLSEIGLALMTK